MFETDHDVDLAIQSGTALPEQIAKANCVDCDGPVGFGGPEDFEPFIFVIDENDQDWVVCSSCAGPVLNYVDTFFPPVTRSHFILDDQDEELDYF